MQIYIPSLLIGAICAVIAGELARHKNRNPLPWVITSFLLGFIPLLILVAAGTKDPEIETDQFYDVNSNGLPKKSKYDNIPSSKTFEVNDTLPADKTESHTEYADIKFDFEGMDYKPDFWQTRKGEIITLISILLGVAIIFFGLLYIS